MAYNFYDRKTKSRRNVISDTDITYNIIYYISYRCK